MFVDGFAFAFAGSFVSTPELVEEVVIKIRGGHGLLTGFFGDADISASGDAFDGDELLKNLADFAVVEDLKFAHIGNAIAELLGDFDDVAEVLGLFGIFAAGETQIFLRHIVAGFDHLATNSLTGEAVGEVFELIIDKLANLHDGIIEGRNGRGGEHDGHDALEILLDIITKLGDLLVAVGFGEEEILHFVGAEGFVGEDVDFC